MRLDKAKFPPGVYIIANLLSMHDYPTYLVGGCVRDLLMGRIPKDWDICTPAAPNAVVMIAEKFGFKVIPTGLKHGTVTIMVDDQSFEVTTFRKDGVYSDNRHPDNVTFTTDLKEDLSRRDFTINAMACRIDNDHDEIEDPFGGIADLELKNIRTVGDPYQRFREDGLRILRALRFASTFSFHITPETSEAILVEKELLRNISAERINSEFCKILMGPRAGDIFMDYPTVFAVFIPELYPMIGYNQMNPHHNYDLYTHTIYAATDWLKEIPLEIRLALFFHDFGKVQVMTEDPSGIRHYPKHGMYSCRICDDIMKRMKFDNKTIELVTTLVLYHDATIAPTEKAIKRWMRKIGSRTLQYLLTMKSFDYRAQRHDADYDREQELKRCSDLISEILQKGDCFEMKDLAINGMDIILHLNIRSGPLIGKIKNDLFTKVIDDELPNEPTALLQYAKETYSTSA